MSFFSNLEAGSHPLGLSRSTRPMLAAILIMLPSVVGIGLVAIIDLIDSRYLSFRLALCGLSMILGMDANKAPSRTGEGHPYTRGDILRLVIAVIIQISLILTGTPVWKVLPFTGMVASWMLMKRSLDTPDESV